MSQTSRTNFIIIPGLLLTMFMAALDQTVVNTALPKVIAHLGGFNLYSWVFTAYMLAATTAIPIFGKLSDTYGRRPFYLSRFYWPFLGQEKIMPGFPRRLPVSCCWPF